MKLSRVVSTVWILIGALFLMLLTLWGPDAVLPIVGLMLISFPASYLASPMTELMFDFPVRVEGMPFPSAWWVYAVLTLVLGYLQWFVVLPRFAAKVSAWHRTIRL